MSLLSSENIYELEMPAGFFSVLDGNEKIDFSVRENSLNDPYWVYKNKERIGEICAEGNYKIILDVKRLSIGRKYIVQFSDGEFEYCESDEGTKCFTCRKDGWMAGIGFFDPNEAEKLRQGGFIENNDYDESDFKGYRIGLLEKKNGFWFELIDKKIETIVFPVAWLKEREFDKASCNAAMGFWLT